MSKFPLSVFSGVSQWHADRYFNLTLNQILIWTFYTYLQRFIYLCTFNIHTEFEQDQMRAFWLSILTNIIIIHSFYIALFSALGQTHCAQWHVILNEWLYPFIACIINIHGSGGLIALFGCCMAGATWNAAISAQVLCTTFNHAPGYSVTSFKAT